MVSYWLMCWKRAQIFAFQMDNFAEKWSLWMFHLGRFIFFCKRPALPPFWGEKHMRWKSFFGHCFHSIYTLLYFFSSSENCTMAPSSLSSHVLPPFICGKTFLFQGNGNCMMGNSVSVIFMNIVLPAHHQSYLSMNYSLWIKIKQRFPFFIAVMF